MADYVFKSLAFGIIVPRKHMQMDQSNVVAIVHSPLSNDPTIEGLRARKGEEGSPTLVRLGKGRFSARIPQHGFGCGS